METSHVLDDEIRSKKPFLVLLRIMMRPEYQFVNVLIIYVFISSLINLAVPVFIQSLVNNLGIRYLDNSIILFSLSMFVFLIFSTIIQAIQVYIIEILQRRFFIRYGGVVAERLMKYKFEEYVKVNTPALINRYFDVIITQKSIVILLVDGVSIVIQSIIGLTLMSFYHPYLFIFSLIIIGLMAINWIIFGPLGMKAGSPEADGKYAVAAWLEDLGRTKKLFLSGNSHEFSLNKLERLMRHWLDKRSNLFSIVYKQGIGLLLINCVVSTLLVGLGGKLVISGELSLGQLVAASIVILMILSSLPRFATCYAAIYDFSTSLDKIAEFYDLPVEREDGKMEEIRDYEFEFKKVQFPPNINFNIKFLSGKKYYIWIKSFTAQKCLIDLMLQLSNSSEGSIYVDGIHIEEINLNKLRDKIQLIEAGNHFNGTIMENLTAFSGREVSYTEIENALERVGLLENINRFPEHLNEIIHPYGHPLSMSQNLALQFARAIIDKPKVLIITSDFEKISTQKRKLIFQEITKSEHQWTLLFFTQRKFIKGDFDYFASIDRDGVSILKNSAELNQMVENYEQV